MNLFDKVCAVPAFVLAVLLLLLGIPGFFTGCKANFVLPPVLGVIPAIVGWGIIRSIWIAWRGNDELAARRAPTSVQREWNEATQAKVELDENLTRDQDSKEV